MLESRRQQDQSNAERVQKFECAQCLEFGPSTETTFDWDGNFVCVGCSRQAIRAPGMLDVGIKKGGNSSGWLSKEKGPDAPAQYASPKVQIEPLEEAVEVTAVRHFGTILKRPRSDEGQADVKRSKQEEE